MKFETVLIAGITAMCVLAGVVWMSGGAPTATTEPQPSPADDVNRPKVSPTPPHPKAVVESTVYQFGVMEAGQEMSHTFVVQNKGEAPLELQKGPTDCKCTVSELEDGKVPPGGSSNIELTWRPLEADDNFLKTATIYTNDPDHTDLVLSIEGRVAQSVQIEPDRGDWNLGNLSESEPMESTGAVYSAVVEDFEITEIDSPKEYIEVTTTPMTDEELSTRRAKSGHSIKLRVSPEMPIGSFREQVKLQTTAGKGEGQDQGREIMLYISGRRMGPVQILPVGDAEWHPQANVLNLGRFSAAEGKQATLSLSVGGLSDEELQITEVEADPKFLKVELKRDARLSVGGRQRYELTFEVPPGSPRISRTREKTAKVKIKTNHPEIKEFDFRLVIISL